ncbi:indole-3-glycerol phosphate synthase TrpC [Streptomyces sp. SP17BM10]|uniref:indole-3-glycerol phosphate synthase TrpC n=1 Tax=Streptomyces sp. SP17BM10 TaxID=3002530 RepID=UPI002E78E288|nr:indole-3-glycerol phosphate synthase TrpC [Streptomyces sp. SP17BM10]MEE1783431.1 indole-3-glycerol phosphate synthase TrpC [Streptomyces sp. SP17BM10]
MTRPTAFSGGSVPPASPVRPGLLGELIEAARRQTETRRTEVSLGELAARAAAAPAVRDFGAALRAPGLGVIAELKPRSPLKGPLTDDYRPADLARRYQAGGACALSVLAHTEGFGGRPEDLATVRAAVELPLMRKDFIVDEYQIAEARAFGADAVLLVVAALDERRLAELHGYARDLGLHVLVEVHSEAEADTALAAGAVNIGVNHRDLTDFSMDLGLTGRLRRVVPADRVLVAESGVRTPADARRLRADGADAVLVGETLMTSADPAATVAELKNSSTHATTEERS